jgi:phosphotransferase system enzyme I (PtsI)
MVRAVEAARRRSIPVGVCGELVAHAGATELLVGLGVEELSTLPAAIVPLKHRIRRLSFQQAQQRLRVFLREGVLTT